MAGRWRAVCVMVLLLTAPGRAAVAAGQASAAVGIEAPERFQNEARRIARIDEEQLAPALRLTGRPGLPRGIRVLLVGSDSPVAAEVPSWASGFTVAESRTIVLFPDRVASYPVRSMEALVVHEIAHILVADAAGGRTVPRWLNEGIATVAAREWSLEDRARYAAAVVGQGPTSTRDLDRGFEGNAATAARSYALSAAAVRFLLASYDEGVTARLLQALAGDLPFGEAFVQVTGDPLARFEEAFFEDEAFWYTWVPFLTSSVALWMAITLLALVAIRRRRERSRMLRESWEREEQAAVAVMRDHLRWRATSSAEPPEWIN